MLKNQKAFTLIELMVTLAVFAIVAAFAIPNFNSSAANNRSVSLGNELIAALNLARTEAVKRGSRVTVCASSDGVSCLAVDNWAKGWLVFADTVTTDTGAPVVAVDNVLRYWKDMPSNAVVTAIKATSETKIDYVRFTGLGMLARAGNDSETREIKVYMTKCKGKQESKIKIGIAGIVTSSMIDCP